MQRDIYKLVFSFPFFFLGWRTPNVNCLCISVSAVLINILSLHMLMVTAETETLTFKEPTNRSPLKVKGMLIGTAETEMQRYMYKLAFSFPFFFLGWRTPNVNSGLSGYCVPNWSRRFLGHTAPTSSRDPRNYPVPLPI